MSLERGALSLSVCLLGLVSIECSREGDTDSREEKAIAVHARPAEVQGASPEENTPPTSAPSREDTTRSPISCPEGMASIPGGSFWVGSARETYEREENPRFRTQVAAFCADVTEVTVTEYESCVSEGRCAPPHGTNKTCNTSAKGRGAHPINCIDHSQALAVCARRDARLPTELEWEYLARGGAEMRAYPWGEEEPDTRTCWKNHESCPVKTYAAGAFGLHDVVGNVWEWTESWFGPYPWPVESGNRIVVRGGGWSRRFDKWMKPTLRNREDPKKWGSHLGVRCVMTLPDVVCPYGRIEGTARCAFGVEEVQCLPPEQWNGVRCAPPNATERCSTGTKEVTGRGCVRERVSGSTSSELDLSAVSRVRSPEFDEDCRTNQPTRPVAYRYTGGEHLARNAAGRNEGCKNRDVGVGWNSACCP